MLRFRVRVLSSRVSSSQGTQFQYVTVGRGLATETLHRGGLPAVVGSARPAGAGT
jgi:hypothetical protein